ncbi:hypothetical protein BD779DRAFT_1795874 [Infundibulicybe gibba]|nr:hypothetical protein BD779DRAFT_1795874 [Infundibulicybe gibba]
MQFSTIILVFASLTLTTFAAPNVKRTVAQIDLDLSAMAEQAFTIARAASVFPDTGGSIAQAMSIHNDAVSLGSIIDSGTNDVEGTPAPVSESDGQTIIRNLQGLGSAIQEAVGGLVNKKAAFQAVATTPIDAIITLLLQDIKNLQTSTDSLMLALTNIEPADLQSQVTNIQMITDTVFSIVIEHFV